MPGILTGTPQSLQPQAPGIPRLIRAEEIKYPRQKETTNPHKRTQTSQN